MDPDTFGRFAEAFARFMGTARFLGYMTVFVIVWIAWNFMAPDHLRFDPYAFIFLTLMLSLQASYAAPLILLAQNRQTDRDKVVIEQDRTRDERNLADTEFLTREVVALRIAMRDAATRDFVRSELRNLLEEMEERGLRLQSEVHDVPTDDRAGSSRRKGVRGPRAKDVDRPSDGTATRTDGGTDGRPGDRADRETGAGGPAQPPH
ncbi:DUF1003 domain-containing protein [Ornithinimicrobium ciconiae]|uniref:DUF1003 domain-containing protein n=2 Tax=Ornithinimicrobium ciconiae TaxID=2594265 RepID=A0A516GFD1_9MICO|nr:DUF1003 domain-containing protein [Ornithinimicrobium ciconiae]